MPSRKDCLDDIAKRTGRKRAEVDILAEALDARAQDFQQSGGLGPDEAYARARDEMLKRLADDAARGRRETILNARKQALLSRFYRDTLAAIEKLPAPNWMKKQLARGAA